MSTFVQAQRQTLISKKTRQEFAEALSGFYVLRTIRYEFDAQDINCDENYFPSHITGERRILVEQFYHSLDFTSEFDMSRLIKVFEAVLLTVRQTADNAPDDAFYPKQCLETLTRCLETDGYIVSDCKIKSQIATILTEQTSSLSGKLNSSYIDTQIARIQNSINSDPALAIGSAKELVETCCKSILSERGKTDYSKLDFPKLVKETMGELKLLPSDIPDTAKGAESIKGLLRSLGTISNGLAELRNLYGTGHGKDKSAKGLNPRHARLAVGAAITLIHFLYDTHIEKTY